MRSFVSGHILLTMLLPLFQGQVDFELLFLQDETDEEMSQICIDEDGNK